MSYIIKPRRGLKKDLPVLNEHEIAFTTDTKEIYVGSLSGNQRIGSGDIPTFKTVGNQPIIGEGNIELPVVPSFKTLDGQSVTGSGDIKFKTINGESVVGSGDIAITASGEALSFKNNQWRSNHWFR